MDRIVFALIASLVLHAAMFFLSDILFGRAVAPGVLPFRHSVGPQPPANIPMVVHLKSSQIIRNPAAFVAEPGSRGFSAASPPGSLRSSRNSHTTSPPAINAQAGEEIASTSMLPTYLEGHEVHRGAQLIEHDSMSADQSNEELQNSAGSGRIVLVLWISENGIVDRIEAAEISMPDDLQAIILQKFARSLFVPAQRDGAPVKSRMQLEVVVFPPKMDRYLFPKFPNSTEQP